MRMRYVIGFVCAVMVASAYGQEYRVGQKNKAFSVERLKVKVGDTVNFVNDDPFFHNVYSLSETKLFDLGSYPQGHGRKVTFDEPGIVQIECAIHPYMKMSLEVQE